MPKTFHQKNIGLGLAAAICLAFASSAASAASFTVEDYTLGHQVTSTLEGRTRTTNTAQLNAILDGMAGTSFCVDLEQTIGRNTYNGDVYDPAVAQATFGPNRNYVPAAVLANAWSGDMSGLASASGSGITVRDAITGLQVQIWRAFYGSDISIDDSSLNAGTLAVIAFLESQSLAGYGDSVAIVFSRNQDQLFTPGTPVPEPTGFLTFRAGTLVVGAALRRRNRG